jgi:ATP-dependent helicase/nuclease subunit A
VHDLLAEVEWLDDGGARERAADWAQRDLEPGVREAALRCLRSPELAGMWTRRPRAEVWRERAFEIVLDGAWVTGRFDRVLVEREAGGRVRRAAVFDFKTDRDADGARLAVAAARHAAQINIYRRVVARLTGLSERAVEAEVVFTSEGRRVVVPASG